MDDLDDDDSIAVTFPLWFLIHPTMLSKSFVALTGPNAETGSPFFTDMALAKQFRHENAELAHYLDANAHIDQMSGVLDALQANGFTHITIDHTRRGSTFLPIDEIRACLKEVG